MPSVKLTDVKVKSFKCKGSTQEDLHDSVVPGLVLRASPGGTKTFCLLYRFQGKARRLKLGRYDLLTLGEAREKARELLRERDSGRDPAVALAGGNAQPQARTFVWVLDEYIEIYAKNNQRSWRQTEKLLRREFAHKWRDADIRQIDKHDVNGVIDQIVARSPSSANSAFARLRALFNWAVARDYIDVSPCEKGRMPSKAVRRDRVLTRAELLSIWQSSFGMGYPYGHIIQLLILTAQRRGEVASMRWEDLNLPEARWTIPRELNKSDRSHVLPLSAACVKLIGALPKMHPVLVFPASGGNVPVSGFSKWKRSIDRKCGVENWQVHDIRRTVATEMAALGVDPGIIRMILNHADTSVTAIYNRFNYRPQMADALEAWAKVVEKFNCND